MKLKAALAALAVLVSAVGGVAVTQVAGGGGSSAPAPTGAPSVRVVAAPFVGTPAQRHCTPQDYAMQCALEKLPQPTLPGPNARVQPAKLYGVDFAWGGPRSCAALRSIGAKFAASYFSYDSSGKNWNASLVNQLHACHIGTVGVWETTANRSAQGFAAGVSDAREAARQAAAVGNTNRPIDFAIDFDASGGQVAGYFQGVHSVLGNRAGAYGGYRPLAYLCANHLVGPTNWQTYAWSGGAWLPASCAPLEQYLNGSSYDNDRAIAVDYGQWPAPGPSAADIYRFVHARNASLHAYRAAHCAQPVLGTKQCGQLAWRVVHFHALLDAAQSTHTPCWGKHALLSSPVCQIVRPEVSIWGHARDASQRALLRQGCDGPVGFPRPVRSPVCNKLRQRVTFFNTKARSTFLEF